METNGTHADRLAWVAVVTLAIAVLVPLLSRWGMFLDGVTYAAISRNMAEGVGSWWNPRYTATVHPEFHDHPALGFILQSLFFRVLGDHHVVEKLYGLVVMLVTMALLGWSWTALETDARLRRLAWLPALLWMLAPRWTWAYRSNVLDITLAVFCLLGVASTWKALRAERSTVWTVLAAAALVGGILTKGPVGLFPLMAGVALTVGEGKGLGRAIRQAVVVGLLVVVAMAGLLLVEPIRSNLSSYFDQQVVASLAGERANIGESTERWRLVLLLAKEGWPFGVIVIAAAAFARDTLAGRGRRATGCLLVALSGSLPMIVSPRQSGRYLIPILPVLALAAASYVAPLVDGWMERLRRHRLAATPLWRAIAVATAVVTVVTVTSMAFLARPGRRDRAYLEVVRVLDGVVSERSTIAVDPRLEQDWGLHAYVQRFAKVSLDARADPRSSPVWIAPAGSVAPTGFEPVHADRWKYRVFVRSPAPGRRSTRPQGGRGNDRLRARELRV